MYASTATINTFRKPLLFYFVISSNIVAIHNGPSISEGDTEANDTLIKTQNASYPLSAWAVVVGVCLALYGFRLRAGVDVQCRFFQITVNFSSEMLVKVFVVLLISTEICKACETGQTKQGCLIRNLVCSCGFGCISDYRYDTFQECQNALKGKKKDICKTNNPCMHNGSCIQISQQPGYKCRCEGTGYFGIRCSRACPVPGAGRVGVVFPYECIVI